VCQPPRERIFSAAGERPAAVPSRAVARYRSAITLARTRARQETPGELVRDFDATEVNHAALQLATLHIFETLRDLAPAPGSYSHSLSSEAVGQADEAGASENQKSKIDNASDGEPAPIENQKPKIKNHRRSLLDLKLGGDSAAFVRLIECVP